MNTRPTWPAQPAVGTQHLTEYLTDDGSAHEQAPSDQGSQAHGPAHAVLSEMSRLLLQTRDNMIMGGGLLGAIAIGFALEAAASARAAQSGIFRVLDIGLMCGLVVCWLIAAALLALAGRPVLNALSRIRWRTGSPLDPRASWLTLPPLGANPDEWTWSRVHVLIGAARLARHRIQLADTWTYVTAACFLGWTVLIILSR